MTDVKILKQEITEVNKDIAILALSRGRIYCAVLRAALTASFPADAGMRLQWITAIAPIGNWMMDSGIEWLPENFDQIDPALAKNWSDKWQEGNFELPASFLGDEEMVDWLKDAGLYNGEDVPIDIVEIITHQWERECETFAKASSEVQWQAIIQTMLHLPREIAGDEAGGAYSEELINKLDEERGDSETQATINSMFGKQLLYHIGVLESEGPEHYLPDEGEEDSEEIDTEETSAETEAVVEKTTTTASTKLANRMVLSLEEVPDDVREAFEEANAAEVIDAETGESSTETVEAEIEDAEVREERVQKAIHALKGKAPEESKVIDPPKGPRPERRHSKIDLVWYNSLLEAMKTAEGTPGQIISEVTVRLFNEGTVRTPMDVLETWLFLLSEFEDEGMKGIPDLVEVLRRISSN